MARRFDKYDRLGAYHWLECDPSSSQYNPPLVARYQLIAARVKGGRVLDLGCGDGYLLDKIARKSEWSTGVDCDAMGTAIAAGRLAGRPNCAVIRSTVEELPFRSTAFDAVVMSDVIEHLEKPEIALGEVARVLKPGGELLLTTPKWRADRRWDRCHVKEFTPQALRDLLSEYFSSVTLRYFWPLRWSNWYATRVGWKLIKTYSRLIANPFLQEGDDPAHYGQILAIGRIAQVE